MSDHNNLKTKALRVYIAGPMTGIKDYNRSNFFLAARKIKETTGCFPVHTAWCESGFSHEEYMVNSLMILKTCDVLVILPDSEESAGVKQEVQAAREEDIPMYDLKAFLRLYVREDDK